MAPGGVVAKRQRQIKPEQAKVEGYIAHARCITKRFRKERSRSQEEAARVDGCTTASISQWEVGRILLSLPLLLTEAVNEGVPLSILFEDFPGLPGAIYEKVCQLSPEQQQNIYDMVDGLLTAELARKAVESAHHPNCA